MREKLKTLQNRRKESCSVLDADLSEISQHIEVETPLHMYCRKLVKRKYTLAIFIYLLHACPGFQQRIDFVSTKA